MVPQTFVYLHPLLFATIHIECYRAIGLFAIQVKFIKHTHHPIVAAVCGGYSTVGRRRMGSSVLAWVRSYLQQSQPFRSYVHDLHSAKSYNHVLCMHLYLTLQCTVHVHDCTVRAHAWLRCNSQLVHAFWTASCDILRSK